MRCSGQYFCALPWVHLNLNPDGAVTLCCQSHEPVKDDQGRPLNVQTHTLDEIWNSSGLRDVRRTMEAGERLPHCESCYANEAHGRGSYRITSNRRWVGDGPDAAEVKQSIGASGDGSTSLAPLYFDLRLGNICNLKCTACKPLYSSQIERDPVHSKWITDAPYTRLSPSRFDGEGDWSQTDKLLQEVVEISGNARQIQLAGGEPTINKTQMAWLRQLCEKGRAPEIDLCVVTNLSNVRPDIYDLFSKFRSLRVTLSVDGSGQGYEYVRFPSKWTTLVKNVDRLRETCPKVILDINAVLQAVNAFNVIELFDWADSSGISINLSIGRGLEHYNDFRILPASARREVRARFQGYFARKANRNVSIQAAMVTSILDELEATQFEEPVRRARVLDLMRFINDMDASRRLSFKTMAPDLHRHLVEDVGVWHDMRRFATG